MAGKLEWTFAIDGRPTAILPWDADGDGRDEFVFGTQGVRSVPFKETASARLARLASSIRSGRKLRG